MEHRALIARLRCRGVGMQGMCPGMLLMSASSCNFLLWSGGTTKAIPFRMLRYLPFVFAFDYQTELARVFQWCVHVCCSWAYPWHHVALLHCELSSPWGGDKVTDYLVKILATPHVQRLESREQLGLVIIVTYLRSPDFAQYVFETCSQQRISLLGVIHQFFRDTNGVGQRKAYMPSRVISKHGKKLRPNRDLGQLRLAGALSLCGQFLDGTLDAICFLSRSVLCGYHLSQFWQCEKSMSPVYAWAFDFQIGPVARLDMIQCDASKLMGTHFLQTLEALGRLARASQECSSDWNNG